MPTNILFNCIHAVLAGFKITAQIEVTKRKITHVTRHYYPYCELTKYGIVMGINTAITAFQPPTPLQPKLIEQLRNELRLRHYSLKTEESYVNWYKRYVHFHGVRHAAQMGADEVGRYLTHLAVERHVAASTQNQALNAIIFLYKHVLKTDVGLIQNIVRAKRPKRVPETLSREEVQQVLEGLTGTWRLMGRLLYGTGMRLMECLRLRVKDVDFNRNIITVRMGKGAKDRRTMLPNTLKDELQAHVGRLKRLWDEDRRNRLAGVEMPDARAGEAVNL